MFYLSSAEEASLFSDGYESFCVSSDYSKATGVIVYTFNLEGLKCNRIEFELLDADVKY